MDSRTVLRIRCRSSSEYLGTAEAVGVGSWFDGPAGEPEAAPAGGAEGPPVGGAEGPSNSSSPLGAWEAAREGSDGAIEARSLRGRPRLFAVIMTMVLRSNYPNGLADPLGLELLEL